MSVSVCVRVFYSMYMMYLNLFSVIIRPAFWTKPQVDPCKSLHSVSRIQSAFWPITPPLKKTNMDLSSARPESAASGGRMCHHPAESSFPCLARKQFGRIDYICIYTCYKTIWVCVLSCVYERTYVFNIQVINVHFMYIYIYICVCVCVCVHASLCYV